MHPRAKSSPPLQNLNPDLLAETEKLTRSWAQHEAAWLRSYLVAGVEDPRINLQSILSRHFLIRSLAENHWDALMAEEYRFSAAMNWLQETAGQSSDPELRAAILHALKNQADNAEGLDIPHHVLRTFSTLPHQVSGSVIPNYVADFLLPPAADLSQSQAFESALNTFGRLWRSALATRFPGPGPVGGGTLQSGNERPPPLPSVIEPACGSANDYRFLHSYGLASLFAYTGFDLCRANVENARSLFPDARFEPGNVFEISAPDKAFDLCIVHDLFEHLSLAGMEQAVREVCRVTRAGLCVGFFQLEEIPQHIVRPRDDYFWNLLSLPRMRELFARQGFRGQVIHIGSFLAHHTGLGQTHNPNAYTFVLQRP